MVSPSEPSFPYISICPFHAFSRRFEREKLGTVGVEEVWGCSPAEESMSEYVYLLIFSSFYPVILDNVLSTVIINGKIGL